ncbi:ABC transporter substrate-binding protein [Paenibacillus polymyxa]|uniref:ABC transporter substrate-binding protein n=1 Tax=Paenibacillus polymyxa TaxID=1406 RepID=UPI0025B68115|nr:cobalamin-binding protein [Paenibacillus polymyxa]MDN4084821.1 cobalamin-binding protein [Paenibacillus polymyxa]MDN4086773.1 cobalamin-binding protein [Paenibacillus polymyxa]MDN4108399.1 cobalamin-binding protein [Paenibacillus polymyxa]
MAGKKIKVWTTGLLALILAVVLSSCGANGKNVENKEGQASSQQPGQTVTAQEPPGKTVYPLTVKDATGQEFTFKKAPDKIVSVSPAETEALFAIGLDKEIVGVSDYSDYPEAATKKPKVGGIMKPNEEAIIAANPDVVFAGISLSEQATTKLRDMGIMIFKTEPKTVEDVIANIELYGKITDHQKEARAVTDKMRADVAEVKEGVKNIGKGQKLRIYVEFSPGWTVGKGEFMDELITLAGGENVGATQKGWYQISEENIIAANPDVILYSKSVKDDKTGQSLGDIIKARSGWDQISAVRNNRVFAVDDNLISRPGPRVTEGLKEVAKGVYPEIFK